MSGKHTPGPWEISERVDGDYAIIDGENWFEFAKVVIRMEGNPENDQTGMANARLIAAAPDLLDALRQFEMHYPHGVNPYLDQAYRLARAAIAKAEGRE